MPEVKRRMRGHYFELLGRVHQHVRPRTYLEIGMHTGKSLELAVPETRIVGVDPVPAVRTKINHTAKLFFETSDDFFAGHDVRRLLDGTPLDMAFIDGMHLFEFALRDFREVERLCNPDGVILVHDCFPLDEASTDRVRSTQVWTGDTWKLIPCLKEMRPDLEITTVAVNPSGLTMIRGLDPTSRVLFDRYEEALQRFANISFSTIDGRQEEALNVVANEWDEIATLLPGPFTTPGSVPAATKRYPRSWPVVKHQAVRQSKLAVKKVLDRLRRR